MRKVALVLGLAALTGQMKAQSLLGFREDHTSRQLSWERSFDSLLSGKHQDEWMKELTSHPHHVGSPQDQKNAEYIARLFRDWGYDTQIVNYYVLFPTPREREVSLLTPIPYKLKLEEPALKEDATSSQKAEQLPTYNAYSGEGDINAEIVFVNRGVPADYEMLERMGISVKGKIVLAKYGGSWRGIKPKLAYEHGAVGCLIYSDPADDGYVRGDEYPKGPFRPAGGAQRGSVMDMPVYPGDPTTPGYASTKNAKHIDRKDAITLMKIPVLPISYEDAMPLLKDLSGPVAPAAWKGGLPFTYHVGPSAHKVHMKLSFNWDIKPLNNVIATLKGSELPDEWVMRGNHHDAWVNGAADPVSGLVSMMDEARSIGLLAKAGTRPRRTLVYCAWDGEEPALLGSTEWAEDHEKELRAHAVAYVNSDNTGKGFVYAAGSHTLEPFVNQVLDAVNDPETGISVKQRAWAHQLAGSDRMTQQRLLNDQRYRLAALGAGSDYSPFIQHLGIPSLNLGYGGEDEGGEYHSIYDSYDLFTRFKDPGYVYGVALSQTAGRLMLRLANADVLPFQFQSFANTLEEYLQQVKDLARDERLAYETDSVLMKNRVYQNAANPAEYIKPPLSKGAVPFLDFSPLENALYALKQNANAYQEVINGSLHLPLDRQKKLNEVLSQVEQYLTRSDGLPRRSWYKHQIYAPGFYTGYGVKTLPAIREAIEQYNFEEAQSSIRKVAEVLNTYTTQVKEAVKLASPTVF